MVERSGKERHESHELARREAETFVKAILGDPGAGVDGDGGRWALGLALEVVRLVRERLQRLG